MTATVPEPAPLPGHFVRLDPMTADDYPGLFDAVAKPEVFAGGYGGGAAGLPRDLDEFASFAAGYYNGGTNQSFTIRLVGGQSDGLIVGTSTLGDFDEANEHAHLGWTAYDPRVWGTAVNPEAKLLLLGLAFDSGFGRVKLQADERNAQSRAAIARIGATFEGLIRRDKRRADGSWRTSAVYSVLVEEWPAIRAGLEKRLARIDEPVALTDR
ncbi:N-acetyltransferase [Mycetocola manganoxydans]|uniref:N-acetyltransferase n=1 Tax=Mycetocola manganoxydans TaxID=699879 RepID=A0A3L6ZYX2_9MICO|nr:GNAT family protein [Mycetocola manganoxydans]RLP72905.1 N-acetyltransferase [Mycetocola manganoxydans]GHD45044.1 alanine acetyltransferase [Mycetocola manganoxydans]